MAKKSMQERLRDKQKNLKNSGNYNYFIFKEGITRLRHLPPPADEEFAVEVQYIFLSKELGGFISPASWGDKCAFHIMEKKLLKSKSDSDKKLAKKLKAKRKFVSASVRYKDAMGKELDHEAGIKLALLAVSQYNDMIDLYCDEESGDFTDPKTGYDLKHKRVGSGMMDTEYSVLKGKESVLDKKYRGKEYDSTKMAKELTPTYEETKELLEKYLNIAQDDDDDEPQKKSTNKKKKKRDL